MPEAPAARRQGAVGGVAVTLLAESIALPAGLLTAVVLTRGLGPELYGRFVVVASTVAIIEWLLIAVFARPVVKFVAEAEDWRPVAATSFRLYVVAGVAIGAGLWLLADVLSHLLRDPALAGDFRRFAPQVPAFAVGAACRNVLAGQARYREQAITSAIGWLGRVTFIVMFVWLGYGIDGAIGGSVLGTTAGAAAALLAVGGAVWGRAGFPARALFQLAAPAFLALLSSRLLDQMGLWILQVLAVTGDAVGYYGAAMNVMLVTSVIAAAVTPVLLSTVAAARYRRDLDQVHRVSRGAIRFGLVLLPFGAVVAGAAPELVPLLFGAGYGPAAPLLAMLMMAALARALFVIVGAMFIAFDRAWTAAWLALPLPVLAGLLLLAVVPAFGAIGAAMVTLAVAATATLVAVLAAGRLLELPLPGATVLRSVVIGLAAFGAAATWPAGGVLVLAKMTVLGLLVAAALAGSGEVTRAEWDGVRAVARARPGGPPGRRPSRR